MRSGGGGGAVVVVGGGADLEGRYKPDRGAWGADTESKEKAERNWRAERRRVDGDVFARELAVGAVLFGRGGWWSGERLGERIGKPSKGSAAVESRN